MAMTLEEIKNKTQYGDYTTLAKMLDINPATAKMRLLRGDEEAKEAMEQVISTRETLIKEFRTAKTA